MGACHTIRVGYAPVRGLPGVARATGSRGIARIRTASSLLGYVLCSSLYRSVRWKAVGARQTPAAVDFCRFSLPSVTNSETMEYVPITEDKFDDVIHHLRYNFPDEPLNASVGLCKHGQPCELLEHHDLMTMKDGLSVMALDKQTGAIAGVSLNGIARKGDIEQSLEEMKSVDNIPYQRIFGLLNTVNKEADLFEKYNVDKIFELRILSVDSKYRGQGVAKELFSRSELIAEESGFKIMKVDATSHFTQKITESLGFKAEKCVKYGDYKDENGKKIYDTKSPHDYYKVMVKRLPTKPNNG